MEKMLAFLVPILAAAGCSSSHHHHSSEWILTPQGYRVCWMEQGTTTTGRATLDQVYVWHSKAVERAAGELAAKGVDKAAALAQAKKTPWILVDNHSFQVGDRWVVGEFLPANGAAKVAFYVQATCPGQQFVPQDAPPWTVRESYRGDGVWVYGTLPEGRWFPAANNELGHAMGLPGEY